MINGDYGGQKRLAQAEAAQEAQGDISILSDELILEIFSYLDLPTLSQTAKDIKMVEQFKFRSHSNERTFI
ncbi:F-box protein [Criblamydia sequanensis]|uniref:F-box domain-containing protein n=1 Tax=Candidatus Criblamydia sequanensis CRIB-18 TaxID=1437425 RepID=A0A090CYT9_9BACT|nr:F-box protein [Criblamydia sequanensis]CDR33892.1 hypothetical protein CSEC_1066 [Criblamydia sequanensis CRIB-18]